ncbi:uncharacterized protein F5147DRAFT_680112 [Suillus discolor]|uniref:Uncharacterized protein n=1 Tax=Suillus discolor TaxID=1912936 RepID=A0A9P7FEF7_9AGAM|nr:uncharacterized protein F5147DRAFT_680112 [Suillus discolor]KAG2113858.1 hypothetical protein F5147DRAFT_680112 [Suillus discolor]
MVNETSDGRRQWLSNSSYTLSPLCLALAGTSSSMETTQASLKDGGNGDTETKKSTKSFVESTSLFTLYPTLATSSLHTSQALPTQQMNHPEEYTDQQAFFFPQSAFQQSLVPSSSTLQNHCLPQNSASCAMAITSLQQLKLSTASCLDSKQLSEQEKAVPKKKVSSAVRSTTMKHKNSRFGAPLPNVTDTSPSPIPQNYRLNLTPKPSTLRPHCLARDRLRLWLPAGDSTRQEIAVTSQSPRHEISEAQLERILDVIGSSWAQSTKETYGAGLLVFHVFCDTNSIAEEHRCPVARSLLLDFLCSCAGSYSGSSLANYAAGLKAWHLLHGRNWLIPPNELKAVLDGAAAAAPESSKRPKRLPFTPAYLSIIRDHLGLNSPLDAAIFACLTTTFYAIARLGEFTVNAIKEFDPKKHITRSGVSKAADRNGLPVTKFHLPSTKCSPNEGEEAYWAMQEGPSDPSAALENHLRINPANGDAHLFAWKHAKGLPSATAAANLPELKGHGLRIGGTLEYLLRGVPFEVVKTMGRWSSEAFTLYLREHAVILAPYIQASPVLEPFTRYTIPPVW